MRKSTGTACLLAIAFLARAQHPGFTPLANPAAFRQQFRAGSAAIHSFSAAFVQEKNLSMLSEKIVSKGKFWFRRENNVRMEYEQPYPYLLVLNDGHIYIRDGDRENRVSAGSGKMFQQINRIIVDCVKGTVLDNPDFTTKIFEGTPGYLVELTPVAKTLKDFFARINVTIDRKNFSAISLELVEPSGDNTLIRFVNKDLNPSLPDALFALH